MSRSVAAAFLLLSSAVAFAGPVVEAPILGGTQASRGDYPSVVALELRTPKGTALCTGTLITKDWILTAAHCVQGLSPADVKVHFNTVNVFYSPGTVRTASMAIAKPGFSLDTLGRDDIGLVKLSEPMTDIRPTAVNLDPKRAPVGITVTMVGFGATGTGGSGLIGVEYVVQQTSVKCSGFVGSDSDLLCFNQIEGKGKCEGDSGGPSFAVIDGELTEVGITSFGDQDCSQYGADTRTDAERDFILQYVPELYCESDSECDDGRSCYNHHCIATPFVAGGLGAECTGATDCESGVCANDGDHQYCSSTCTVGSSNACPDGLDCVDTGNGQGTCWPSGNGGGGCSASGADAVTGLFGFAFLGLVFSRRRRRR